MYNIKMAEAVVRVTRSSAKNNEKSEDINNQLNNTDDECISIGDFQVLIKNAVQEAVLEAIQPLKIEIFNLKQVIAKMTSDNNSNVNNEKVGTSKKLMSDVVKGNTIKEKKVPQEHGKVHPSPSIPPAEKIFEKVVSSPFCEKVSTQQNNNMNEEADEDGFILKKSRRKRNIVLGKKIDNDLEVAVKEIDLHVWRLSPNVVEQDVVKYIRKNKQDEVVKCERLNARGNYSSFKVSIKETSMDDLMSPEFWPQGVAVDRYFNRTNFPKLS